MTEKFNSKSWLRKQKFTDQIFFILGLLSLIFALLTLLALIMDLARTGLTRISWDFFIHFPSRFPEKAGILSAWVGSFVVMVTTAVFTIPIGVAAAVFLEEYAGKNKITRLIELNVTNLAGVPSIIFGLMALGIFVNGLHLGQSILSAGLTLGCLVLPIVIVTTREALRTVPQIQREASYSLGATRWQTIWYQTLPASIGGILTGVILSLSRAIGETAPLITIGALTFIAFLPHSLMDPFTVLPIQMFNWVSRPQEEFHVNAAATGLILLVMTLLLNGVAIALRTYFRKKIQW